MSLLFITLKDSVIFSAPFLLGLHPCILLNTILSMRRLRACVGLGQMCGRYGIVICFVLPFDVFPVVIHVWKVSGATMNLPSTLLSLVGGPAGEFPDNISESAKI